MAVAGFSRGRVLIRVSAGRCRNDDCNTRKLINDFRWETCLLLHIR